MRVVAAIAARAIALLSGGHVIIGQMMAPEARSKHGSSRPNARARWDIRALKRVRLGPVLNYQIPKRLIA